MQVTVLPSVYQIALDAAATIGIAPGRWIERAILALAHGKEEK